MGHFRQALKRLPYVRHALDAVRLVRDPPSHPPGHYYSPIPSATALKAREHVIWQTPAPRSLPGIDLRASDQLDLVSQLARYHTEQPFPDEPTAGSRYFFNNDFYPPADAVLLYCLMRHIRPARVIEVGSGYSSAVMLDTDEMFLDSTVAFSFIDPHPERLQRLMKPGDDQRLALHTRNVQDVDLDLFKALRDGDILFVDSSHVTKTDSDVNTLFFEVLPQLASGVWIHIHDIFYPFEYPKEYSIDRKWAWNEAYLLRSFLQFNSDFAIRLFPSYLEVFHAGTLHRELPLTMRHPRNWPNLRGTSVWLQRETPCRVEFEGVP